MARENERPTQRDDGRPYWRFPDLANRVWQQFETVDRTTGIRTKSRSCTRCGKFMLVRYEDGKKAVLTAQELRFVAENRTPCEHD